MDLSHTQKRASSSLEPHHLTAPHHLTYPPAPRYNLSRSHRDRPMLDRAFMDALEETLEGLKKKLNKEFKDVFKGVDLSL